MPRRPVTILTICGCGVGSSVLLAVNIKNILRELGIDGEVRGADVTTCKGEDVDIVINQPTWMAAVKGMRSYKRCVVVKNIVNKKELAEKLKAALEDLGLIEGK